MPRYIATVLAALALMPSLASGATNLIANPRFDADVGGWNFDGVAPVSVTWNALDETGKPASGSLRMSGLLVGATNKVWSNCIPVSPGSAVVFGASAYAPESSPYQAYAKLRFFDAPGCGGSLVDDLYPAPATYYSLQNTTWGGVQGNGVVPAGAQSAWLFLSSSSGVAPPAAVHFDNAYVYEGESCASATTMACMNDRRFRVAMQWKIPDGSRGYGALVPFSGDSLRATFFDAANVEMVLKVLDGCAVNQRYWVFAAGLTNVEVRITVTDTHTGTVRTYENPLDQAFAPVQDTGAFDACPH